MRKFRDPVVTCVDCGAQVVRTAGTQKRCEDCRRRGDLAHNQRWRDANKERLNAARRAKYAADPAAVAAAVRRRREADPERYSKYHRDWRKDNRLKIELQRKCREFGITMDDLTGLFDKQRGRCPICLDPIEIEQKFDLDHCHATGRVRGALHDICNRGIGMLRDDPDRCERAAVYLRQFN